MTSLETQLCNELLRIASAVEITSPTTFVFADLPEVSIQTDGQRELSEVDERRTLVETLSDMLYWNCYVQRFGAQPARPLTGMDIDHDPAFQKALAAANQGQSKWDPGWSVIQVGDRGEIQVRKGECYRTPVPGEFLFDAGPGVRPQRGDGVSLRIVRDSILVQPGFYFCFSEEVPDQFEEFDSVRVYFNLRPAGATLLLYEVTGRLNRFQIPYRFKCPVTPEFFNRRDSGVLYIPFRFWECARHLVEESLPHFEHELEDDTPLFTKRVRAGVAVAEDPGGMRSFGQYRCELLAQGILDASQAYSDGRAPAGEDAIKRVFRKAGVDLARPWLNCGSQDVLELPTRRTSISGFVVGNHQSGNAAFLETADRIGSRICRDAIWSGGLCNWLEWETELVGGSWLPVHRALGANATSQCGGVSLYAGSSGVALFLATLSRFTQERHHKETALASARQVLEQVRGLSRSIETGFYTGWPGAIWTLAEIAGLLDEEALIDASLCELQKLLPFQPVLPYTDIINGSAGLILGLIDLGVRFQQSWLLEIAVQHGTFLLDSAETSDVGTSWITLDVPVRKNLTGYGHGVSGIVIALAELHRVTGDERFAKAVYEGVRYESDCYSERLRNWEDHRTDVWPEGQSAAQVGWCHGAPGIALSRLRLLELGFDSVLIRRDLNVAVETTRSKLAYADADHQRAFGLCHGLAGNCDVPLLLADSSVFSVWQDGSKTDRASLFEDVNQVAQSGIEQFSSTGIAWPGNLAIPGETPTLFNGTAGIGYFYLRAFAPHDVRSVLLIKPAHEAR